MFCNYQKSIDPTFYFYTDPEDVPVALFHSIPKVEKMIDFIQSEKPILAHFVTENESTYSLEVLFNTNEDANTVVNKLCYSSLKEREILVTHYKTPQQITTMNYNKLTIRYPADIYKNCNDICNEISKFGKVYSVERKESYAVVIFESIEDSLNAKMEVNKGNTPFKPLPKISGVNFPHDITAKDVREHFPSAVSINIKSESNLPAKVILSFCDDESAVDAINKGNEIYYRKLKLHCFPYVNNKEVKNGDNKNSNVEIFVGNIHQQVEFEDFVNSISILGNMENVTLKKKKGAETAFAFVEFKNAEDARNALSNIKNISLKGLQLYAKILL